MYRIMLVKSKQPNYASLYSYLTTTVDGVVSPVELADGAALDAQVEKMLDEGGYAKSDFIIVQVIDYSIDAKNYSGGADQSDDGSNDNSADNSENDGNG